MINKNLLKIMYILKYANGALYQKHLIKIFSKDINERQVRRYLKKLKELEFLKVHKLDNRGNILYLTAKGYKEIFNIKKRISSTSSNYILENNFIVAYMKYKYNNIFENDIFPELYDKSNRYINSTSKALLKEYKYNIIMHNMYIYNHQEMIEEEYITILQILIYKHKIDNKCLKKLIIILNEIIERFVDIENNIMIDYKIYSLNNININLLDKSLDKYYSKKENFNEVVDKYNIESFNLRDKDIYNK